VSAEAGHLSQDELFAFVLLLFVNGLETLTAGLTMATWELLQHREDASAIANDSAYAESIFDEAVRLHSPVRFSGRTLTANVELNGHQLHAGDVVALFFAAANRDPRQFTQPDSFNPRRPRVRHAGFGHGAHFCLGAQLSLVAGAVVLQQLAKFGDGLHTEVTQENMAWSPSLAFNTLTTLPVQLSR
jgi:cytochrome P450